MPDINLLPTEEKASDSLNSFQKKLTFFSIFILAVVAIFTIATLVMFTARKAQEAKLKQKVADAATSVSQNQLTEELLTVVNKKAESASKVIDGRLLYTDILTKTADLMPKDVYFTDLKVNGTKISSGAKAKTSADVANLVSSFVTSNEGKKLFSSVSIDSLGTDENNSYSFTVSMAINPNRMQESSSSASAQGGLQ